MKTFSAIFILGFLGILLLPSISFAASISSISPSSGQRGDSLTIRINGSGFTFPATSFPIVTFQTSSGTSPGIQTQSGVTFSSSRIDVAVVIGSSATLGIHKITVQESGTSGSIELANAFTVTAPADFRITSISPSSSIPGRALSITIQGSDFNTGSIITSVNFIRIAVGSGNISTSNIRVANSQRSITLSAVIPAGTDPGTFQVQVTQLGVTKSINFTVTGTSGSTPTPSIPTGTVPTTGEPLPPGFALPTGPTSGKQIIDLIQTAGNWVFAILLSLSLIYILLGAFQFVTGGGNPEEISKARQKLVYAIIGIVLALVAAGFDNVLRNILGLQ